MLLRMETILFFFRQLNHLEDLIRWGGYAVLAAIVFSETGLLVGFFLPGDSLIVTAGLLAARGYLNIWELLVLLSLMAIAGDTVGYHFGKITGPKIFTRDKSILFAKDHLLRARAFYDKYGNKTIVLARFIPIIRTFAPIVAGVARMPYRKFLTYNIFGGIGWVVLMLFIGFFLGRLIPGIDHYLDIVIAVVILLSITPAFVEWWRERSRKPGKA